MTCVANDSATSFENASGGVQSGSDVISSSKEDSAGVFDSFVQSDMGSGSASGAGGSGSGKHVRQRLLGQYTVTGRPKTSRAKPRLLTESEISFIEEARARRSKRGLQLESSGGEG